jgi:hypothetical protein
MKTFTDPVEPPVKHGCRSTRSFGFSRARAIACFQTRPFPTCSATSDAAPCRHASWLWRWCCSASRASAIVKRLTPSRSISAGSTPPVRSTQPAPAKAGDHRGFVHTVLVGHASTAAKVRSKAGRHIKVHPREKTLQRSRQRQGEPAWRQRYRSTRPKVERKLSHMMFRRHGGRRARVRGRSRVAHDFAILAAAVNLKRLAVLGVGAVSTLCG